MGQEPAPAAPGQTPEPTTPAPASKEAPKTFDEEYVKKLRAEAAGYRTELSDVRKRLKDFEDAGKSDAEKAAQRAEESTKRVTELETERSGLLRELVAARHGLDDDMAARLRGDTRDELEADAKALAKKYGKPGGGGWDGGRRGGGDPPPDLPEDASPLQRLAHAYGNTK